MFRYIILCAVFLVIQGCAVREVPPILQGNEIPQVELQNTFKGFAAKRNAFTDLKSLIRVRLISDGKSDSFRYAVVFKRPASLRIETFPLNGFYTLATLGVFGNSLVSLVPSESQAYTGAPSREVLGKALGLPLSVDEIAGLLLAEPPAAALAYAGVRDEGMKVRRYLSSDKTVYIETPLDTDDVSRMKFFVSDKGLIADATYSDYRDVQGLRFPHAITLKLLEVDMEAELRIQKFQLNTDASDSLFLLEVPEGYSVTDIN